MKFEVTVSDLKEMVNKVGKVVPLKTSFPALKTIMVTASDGTITLTASNIETELNVFGNAFVAEPGTCGIDYESLKQAVTLKTEKFTIFNEDGKIIIKAGKKILSFPEKNIEDLPLLKVEGTSLFYTSTYKDFLEMMRVMSCYVSTDDNAGISNTYCFDAINRNIVALDRTRIAVRHIPENFSENNTIKELNIPNAIYEYLKRCLKSKDDSDMIVISTCSEKNDKVKCVIDGNDFQLITKIPDGKYYDYRKIMTEPANTENLVMSKMDMMDVSSYNEKLTDVKQKKPMIIANVNGEIYTYAQSKNKAIESIDRIDTMENTVCDGFIIGVNPEYITDLCRNVDTENLSLTFFGTNAPILSHGKEYDFLILPFNIKNMDIKEDAISCIQKLRGHI